MPLLLQKKGQGRDTITGRRGGRVGRNRPIRGKLARGRIVDNSGHGAKDRGKSKKGLPSQLEKNKTAVKKGLGGVLKIDNFYFQF